MLKSRYYLYGTKLYYYSKPLTNTEPTHHMVAGTHLPSPTPYRVIIYKSMLYGMKINEMQPSARYSTVPVYRTFSSRPAGRVSAWDRIPLQKYYYSSDDLAVIWEKIELGFRMGSSLCCC